MKIRNNKNMIGFWLSIVFPAIFFIVLLAPGFSSADTYEYDSLNRLIRVVYDDGKVVTYAYDAAGNVIATNDSHDSGGEDREEKSDGGGGSGLCFITTATQGNHMIGSSPLLLFWVCLGTCIFLGMIRT